jgi:hypothetical protein
MTFVQRMPAPVKQAPRMIESTEKDGDLADSLIRLLRSLRSSDASRVLGRQLVREIIYRILMGEKGSQPGCDGDFGGHFSQLSRTLQRIRRVPYAGRGSGVGSRGWNESFRLSSALQAYNFNVARAVHKGCSLHNARFMNASFEVDGAGGFGRGWIPKSLPVRTRVQAFLRTISHRGDPENFVWKRI